MEDGRGREEGREEEEGGKVEEGKEEGEIGRKEKDKRKWCAVKWRKKREEGRKRGREERRG